MSEQEQNPRRLADLEWLGGHPALDFVNTVHSRTSDAPEEYLHSFDDLVRWNEVAGLLDGTDARRFQAREGRRRNAAYRNALHLREHLYTLLSAAARGATLPVDAISHLEECARDTAPWRRLVTENGRLCWVWDFADAPPEAVVGPVVWATTALLESGPVDRIKACPPPQGCGWLFLDQSRNRSRHWCNMKTCGNVAKVRRYRQRHGR